VTRWVGLLAAGLLALTASACTHSTAKTPAAAAHSYDGPLFVSAIAAEHPGAGAASNVVHCRTWGHGGVSTAAIYSEGATSDSPDQALDEVGIFQGTRAAELRVAKKENDRVLYVTQVHGVVKQAVIVRNGPATEGAGGPGWYVESWASCDYSEFPTSVTDSLGLQIWTDSAGTVAPTTTIESYRGPAHCDWQSMTFLALGDAVYVRDPQPELAAYFAEPYRTGTDLPNTAIDTGFHRDGKHLWLSPDKQLAFVGTKSNVEAWPRTIKPLGCA
jgi:hypothetical protein